MSTAVLGIFVILFVLGFNANAIPTVLPLHRRASSQSPTSGAVAPLLNTQSPLSAIFDVSVQIGNQTVLLLVDTGSSDTWVLAPDWQCYNSTSNALLPRAACGYSNSTYTSSDSTSFHPVPGEYFGVQYGGSIVSGIVGREDITLGGITVSGQKFGVVNATSNTGDGIDSGIIGLAYPAITSAHPGSIVNASNSTFYLDRAVYDPLVINMYKQGSIPEPYFSIALDRMPLNATTRPGGYLGLGHLPPVPHSPKFASTPTEISPIPLNFTNNRRQRSFWTITVDEITYGSQGSGQNAGKLVSNATLASNTTRFLAVVDTGNFFTFLPGEVVDAVNGLFEPPAVLDTSTFPNTYVVDCNAKPPKLGFKIGGQTFYHDGQDLILSAGNGHCVSSLVSQYGVSYVGLQGSVLGDPFLKNVVAVFDFGKNEMRFAAREE